MKARWVVLLTAGLIAAGCGGDGGASTTTSTSTSKAAFAQPGDPPTRRVAKTAGVEPRPPKPTVLVSGETQQGAGVEFVLYGTSEGACITLSYTQRGAGAGGSGICGDLKAFHPDPLTASASGSSGHEAYVSGYAAEDVKTVTVSPKDGSTIYAALAPMPEPAAGQAGFPSGLSFFAAFLPPGSSADGATAEAFDASGNSLGTAQWAPLP